MCVFIQRISLLNSASYLILCLQGYEYARSNNPTRECAEQCLASMEGAKHCVTFASGLGATTIIASLLSQGDHIVAMDDLYGGTYRYFSKVFTRMGVEITYVDARDPAKVSAAMKPNTKVFKISATPVIMLALFSLLSYLNVILFFRCCGWRHQQILC